MPADVNEAPKEEDPSGPRGCDRKEEKEPTPMMVEWGVRGGRIFSSYTMGKGTMQKGEKNEGKEGLGGAPRDTKQGGGDGGGRGEGEL